MHLSLLSAGVSGALFRASAICCVCAGGVLVVWKFVHLSLLVHGFLVPCPTLLLAAVSVWGSL